MLASVRSATLTGVDGHVVTVEVHVSTGLPSYHVVGLPDAAVRESRERVRGAVVVAPRVPATADHGQPRAGRVRKTGRVRARGRPRSHRRHGPARRTACSTRSACSASSGSTARSARCPASSRSSTRCAPGHGLGDRARDRRRRGVARARHGGALGALARGAARVPLKGEAEWPEPPPFAAHEPRRPTSTTSPSISPTCVGSLRARALEVAAAGGHHCCSRAARHRKDDARPPAADDLVALDADEALEVAAHPFRRRHAPRHGLARQRPFPRRITRRRRPPSSAAGNRLRARRGDARAPRVLFLDELGEFPPRARRAAPADRGARGAHLAPGDVGRVPFRLPARRVLEPVPVRSGRPSVRLHRDAARPYRRRLSAPLLDRFDLRLEVHPPEPDDGPGEPSSAVRERRRGRRPPAARYADRPWRRNSRVPAGALAQVIPLSEDADAWRGRSGTPRSPGAARRVARVARTLADLEDAEVCERHVTLAAVLREDVP